MRMTENSGINPAGHFLRYFTDCFRGYFTGYTAFLLLAMALSKPLFADENRQDMNLVRKTAEQYLIKETAGLPGTVKINIGNIDARLNLSSCIAPEAFSPTGSRLWGRTTVGVRCTAPQTWVVYVPGVIQVWSDYFITARTIAQGQLITAADIRSVNGDLCTLPTGIVTDESQAVGRISAMSLASGITLRQDNLRYQQVVTQGQTVRLISNGSGFSVSTEAVALNNASAGQLAKVKTTSGQVLSGIAKAVGVVEVNY